MMMMMMMMTAAGPSPSPNPNPNPNPATTAFSTTTTFGKIAPCPVAFRGLSSSSSSSSTRLFSTTVGGVGSSGLDSDSSNSDSSDSDSSSDSSSGSSLSSQGTSEESKASSSPSLGPTTIFSQIISGSIPCSKVYESSTILAFHDVSPVAPVHVLVIPKDRDGLTRISESDEGRHKEILGELMHRAGRIGRELCPGGFRIVVNDGVDGCQSVYHLHLHVIGGEGLGWPPRQ